MESEVTNKQVVRLYPDFEPSESLQGLYLSRLDFAGEDSARPVIYANFLSSLDGRIALYHPELGHHVLPDELKSDEDFQLFLELHAQADCIITHGGYMRSLAVGRLGNVLQLPKIESVQYLHEWRKQRGLPAAPDVVILSASLNFPWHESLDQSQQNVHIATGGDADDTYKHRWQETGHVVYQFGNGHNIDVVSLVKFLQQQQYKRVYLVAGPQLLQDLLAHGFVSRFFITICHRLMAGENFKSLLQGPVLGNQGQLQLQKLHMDEHNSNSVAQWYAEFALNH